MSALLVPWVSQIYLALAGFNLAIKNQQQIRAGLIKKLMLFGSIILILCIEGLIVAPNFGEAISFYPVMLWMILLALFAIVYAFAGIRGMLALTLISLFISQLGVPKAINNLEIAIRTLIHPDFELDARVELFMASGCFGFLYGWVWHHKPEKQDLINYVVIATSIIALIVYVIFGDAISINLANIYAEEHSLAEGVLGRIGIWSMEFLVISSVLILHRRGIQLNWPPINWIGMYSLTVFIFHKSIFVFLWGPLMTLITAKLGITLINSFSLVFALTTLSIMMIYVVKRSGIVCHLMGDHQDKNWHASYKSP